LTWTELTPDCAGYGKRPPDQIIRIVSNEKAHFTIAFCFSCLCYKWLWTEYISCFHPCTIHADTRTANANAGFYFHPCTIHADTRTANASFYFHPCTIHANAHPTRANIASHAHADY
jgi:hypothetical protein